MANFGEIFWVDRFSTFATISAPSGHVRGLQLCRVQSLLDIGDQIGGVLDADRQPDRGVENAYFLADVGRNAGVGHACGQAGKRLGAAQAHRQLEDLQRVQEFERRGLAADNVERKRGASAGALPREQTAGPPRIFRLDCWGSSRSNTDATRRR